MTVVLKRTGRDLSQRVVYLHIDGETKKATFIPGAKLAFVGYKTRSRTVVAKAYVTDTLDAGRNLPSPGVRPTAYIAIPADGNEPALRYPVPPPPPPPPPPVPGPSLSGEALPSEITISFTSEFRVPGGSTQKLYAVVRERLPNNQYDPTDFDDIPVTGVVPPSTGYRSAVEVAFASNDPHKSMGTFSFTFNHNCASRRYIIYYVWVNGAGHVIDRRGTNVGQIEFGPAP